MQLPIEQLHFHRNAQGFMIAEAWGDPTRGPHSNYIRMEGGTASGLHTHSYDYYGVVITGTVINEPVGSLADHLLKPGSFWYQHAGEVHVTKCGSKDPCLFFVTSPGAFDYLMVER